MMFGRKVILVLIAIVMAGMITLAVVIPASAQSSEVWV